MLSWETHSASTVRESLTEAQSLEYRRRSDVTTAIVTLARQKFPVALDLKKSVRARRDAKSPVWWFYSALIAGCLWHWLFSDPKKTFDFTFGTYVVLVAVVVYVGYSYDSYLMGRQLDVAQEYRSELLYRWLANGGTHGEFVALCASAEEEKDLDAWWARQEAHMLGVVTGRRVVPDGKD